MTWIHRRLHRLFGRVGRIAAHTPWHLAIGALLGACLASLGLLLLRWESRIEYSYAPRRLPAFKILERETALFGPRPRLAEFTMVAADGVNILDKEQLVRAMRVHDAVLDIAVADDGLAAAGEVAVRFEDVCERVYAGGPCMQDSALVRTGIEGMRDLIDDMDQETIDAFLISQAGVLKTYLGELRVDEEAGTIRAGSMRFLYFLANVDEPNAPKRLIAPVSAAERRVLAWETAFLTFATSSESDVAFGFELSGVAVRSIDDEVGRNVQGSISFMIGSCAIIFAFMAFWQRSVVLGVAGLITILLAISAGLGLVGLLGVPLTDVSLMIVFVVIGVGVDDIIVLTDFLHAQPAHLPLVERAEAAFAAAGAAISLTSLTNLVAFATSALIDLPGVRSFCIAAALIIPILFVLTNTLFASCLMLVERRRERSRRRALPPRASFAHAPAAALADGDADASGPLGRLQQRSLSSYSRVVTNPIVQVLVVLACIGLIPAAVVVGPRLQIGVDFKDNFPDGSYVAQYFLVLEKRFGELTDRSTLLFDAHVNWTDVDVQRRVCTLTAALDALDVTVSPLGSWLEDYLAFAAGADGGGSAALAAPSSGAGFYDGLRAWLQRDASECADADCTRTVVPKRYTSDIVWAAHGGEIAAARFRGQVRSGGTVAERVASMTAFRAGVEAYRDGLPAVGFASYYVWSERDQRLVRMVLSTLAQTAGSVLAVVLLFLRGGSVALITLSIVAVDCGTICLMGAWRTALDIESIICLTMAIGLSVDYVVHVAHALEHTAAGDAGAARVHSALHEIGGPVLKGGASTLLGVVLLTASHSAIFRTFGHCLVSSTALGLLMALCFFPAAATLVSGCCARACHAPSRRAAAPELSTTDAHPAPPPRVAAPAAAAPQRRGVDSSRGRFGALMLIRARPAS